MAVGNLLQRSTCGVHGTILKHIEVKDVNPTADDHGHGATTAIAEEKKDEQLELLQNGRQAIADLDVIASYMVDFKAIVQARIEAQRAQKKAAAAELSSGNNVVVLGVSGIAGPAKDNKT